ncbi:GNAT family N-acetyltransferase [Achromobacter arsenitoxydans]|uniref:GCN5-like N-acetyltransferase n=1 Tax=Achromobacter arsenitoxydans SY8 TaxID=477184 RepID=H0F2J4_9BURK|nr:GNAT family N-acetyltransferase [Achromobacter arsenitoxydans]EHK67605.1 GCN5-like N-acetyltransferase [Achromobacter arsenitoxydans SY8]
MDQSAHSLDNPIWNALATEQAHLGSGNALACRYHPDVAPFAAMASDAPEAWAALGQLLSAGQQAALLSSNPVKPPPALRAQPVGVIHQMVATRRDACAADDPGIVTLGPDDAPQMLALAEKTRPGPFCKRTHEMGRYIGVRAQGRLIAMAGERMHPAGHVEISAVCVDDAWRGKGFAGRLVQQLEDEIWQRGESPFLHVLSNNGSAIGLYERLGFGLRQTFFLTLIRLAD